MPVGRGGQLLKAVTGTVTREAAGNVDSHVVTRGKRGQKIAKVGY